MSFRDRKAKSFCIPGMTSIESIFLVRMVLLAIIALTSNRVMALDNLPKELVCSNIVVRFVEFVQPRTEPWSSILRSETPDYLHLQRPLPDWLAAIADRSEILPTGTPAVPLIVGEENSVIVFGPLLNSPDSVTAIQTQCTDNGARVLIDLDLTGSIKRSLRRNVRWRPLLILNIIGQSSSHVVGIEWLGRDRRGPSGQQPVELRRQAISFHE